MELVSSFPDRWIAVFDILGFKKLLENIHPAVIMARYNEALSKLSDRVKDREGISAVWFSDTFIIYSADDSIKYYPVICQIARHFLVTCIYSRILLRAAITFGPFYAEKDRAVFIGQAFIEAFTIAELQNWIGLIMLNSAYEKARESGLEPLRHAFANIQIPWKENATIPESISPFAYTFSEGQSNFEHPVLSILEEQKILAPAKDKIKYENTINHIKTYHRPIA
jgi:hypothetical protein